MMEMLGDVCDDDDDNDGVLDADDLESMNEFVCSDEDGDQVVMNVHQVPF